MYKPDQGALVISLDYEKYWGMRDKKSIDAYRQNLEGVDEAWNVIAVGSQFTLTSAEN